jgi:long-subunit acyl-CoA synthetase (AMP-forming)
MHTQGNIDKVQDDAVELKPALFIGVPRVWERVREGVDRKLSSSSFIAR